MLPINHTFGPLDGGSDATYSPPSSPRLSDSSNDTFDAAVCNFNLPMELCELGEEAEFPAQRIGSREDPIIISSDTEPDA
jgi:hypothetical protein